MGRRRPRSPRATQARGWRYTLERVGHFQVEVGAPLFRVPEPAPLDAVGVAPMVVPERQVNHGKNVAWRPRYAFAPGASIDELSNTLRFIDQKLPKSLSIKAGGSRHSWSPAAATSGVYIHPEGIRFIEPAADASMKASVPSALRDKLVRVGSGTRVRELNAALWERGLSLPALGGFDGQTLGGVLPTGTHGSVLKHGPLASRVRSIDLVTARGEHVRIEPKDGLTDPVRFAREHPKMSLVQDDATFQAAQINMGTMGVVHAYVLEAAERFHLTEVRTKTDVADVLRVLEDGNVYHAMDVDQVPPGTPPDRGLRFEGHPERAYHLEVLLNPHSDQVIITSRQPTEVDVEPFDMSRRPGRDLFRSLDLGDRFTRPALSTWLSENLPQAMGWTAEKLTRLLPAATPKVVDQALATLEDPVYVQRSYNVFNIGDGANAIPALSGTLYVPLAGDRYLKALQIFRDTARAFAEKEGRYQTGPLSMRFVRGSEAMLAAGEDVCSFEIIFAGGTPHAEAMMKAYLDALTAELGGEVTFHWGQMLNGLEPSHVAASYPEYPAWKAIRDGLDPDGRFLNSWQRSILPE